MRNIYNATRPAWAVLDGFETLATATVGLLIIGYGTRGRQLYNDLVTRFKWNPNSHWANLAWELIGVIGTAALWYGFVRLYRRRRIGVYPTYFIYCFHVPAGNYNPGHQSRVVGYLSVLADRKRGEIVVEGASHDWAGYLVPNTEMRYMSTHVYGSEKDREIMCHIRFAIPEKYRSRRNFSHGLLQFQLLRPIPSTGHVDQYAGYMKATNDDPEIDSAVRCKGYAEKLNRRDSQIEDILKNRGSDLFNELDKLLGRQSGVPSVWIGLDLRGFNTKNCFGYSIPSPQATLLEGGPSGLIDAALDKLLAGAGTDSIISFVRAMRRLARQDEEFSVGIFETDVKRELTDVRREMSERLGRGRDHESQRQAKAVYELVKDHLEGGSLLDVGCGNALISHLIKSHLPHIDIQLADVVDYRDSCAHHLPFEICEDGHALPGKQQFDTVLLLNVLHHSKQPERLLDEACERTLRRLIVIEPVIGTPRGENIDSGRLKVSEQLAYAAFIDWFYNHILHDDLPLGYNFTTDEKWLFMFSERHMPIVHKQYVNQDIELAPMPHLLCVLEKRTSASLDRAGAAP